MNRCLAFLLALMVAAVTVSSACVAAPFEWVSFTLEPERGEAGKVHASFRDDTRDRNDSSWSSGFLPSELVGLDIAGLRGSGSRPVAFAIVREAGRLDCNGNGGGGHAWGKCRFTADPGFTRMLASRGIASPTRDEAFALMAVNVRREIVDALAAARYPTPKVDDLIALTAVGANGRYIADLAHAGYRPPSVDTLVEFRALNITPDYVAGFTRIGYGAIPADELVQLKALSITPEFISNFDRIGYRHLPVDTLVQLKALGITPEFVRTAAPARQRQLTVDELVQLKLFGRVH